MVEQTGATSTPARVAIVVLSYNGRALLQRFLPGIVASAAQSAAVARGEAHVDVWVVDNASTDGSLELLHAEFPSVKTLRIDVNRGFTNGYVQSLPQISADVYVLINSDVDVTPGWLEAPIARLHAHPHIAAIQPKILAEQQRTHFEYSGAAGGYIDALGYPFCRGRIFFEVEADSGQYNDARPVFWASGACCFVRAEPYHRLGGLDNSFYAHMEEIDLCWRLQRAGYGVWVEPASVVYHVGGHIIRYGSTEKLFHNYRNGLLMLVKNVAPGRLWSTLLVRMLLDGVAGLRGLLAGRPAELGAVLRAHGAFYRRLPAALRLRRRLAGLLASLRPAGTPEPKVAGIYPGSIVWDYFIRQKRRFSQLPIAPSGHEKP